jgi:hypothetical protein
MDPTLILPAAVASTTAACGLCCLGYSLAVGCERCAGQCLTYGAETQAHRRFQIERTQAALERDRARAHARQAEALMRQTAMGAERVAREDAARRELFRDHRNVTHIDARIGHPPVITVRRAQVAVPPAQAQAPAPICLANGQIFNPTFRRNPLRE